MTIQLNHTIVWSRDAKSAAAFLARILGLPAPGQLYHFHVVATANGVSLDFADKEGEITPQHYAFLIGEEDFDAIFARVTAEGLTYWADPARQEENRINTWSGGRGFYFEGPDRHFYEVLTRPYAN